jgi:transposase-like protein
MMKKTHKTRYTKQKMLAYYKEWQESGLGKKAYCTQKGLTSSTFFYWIKKLALQKESFPTPSAAAGFTELTLPAQVDAGNIVVEIEYPSGVRLKLYRQMEASFIKSLL